MNHKVRLLVSACLLAGMMAAEVYPAFAQNDPSLDKVSSSPLPEAARGTDAARMERLGNLLYVPPVSWQRSGDEKAGVIAYIAPGLEAGANFRILVMAGEQLTEDLHPAFEKKMGAIRSSLKAHLIGAGHINELKGPQGADALTRTDIIELPSGARWTCFLCLLHAGNRIESVITFGSSEELYRKHLPDTNRFISQVRFANLEAESARYEAVKARIVAPGEPALTQEMVDRFNLFFEWIFDAPMTDEQRRIVQDSLVGFWKAGEQSQIQTTVKIIETQHTLEKKTDSERDLLRASLQPQLLDQLRKQPNDPSSKWALELYDHAHKTIAGGSPPLTRQMADAYIEMLCFMHNESIGGEPFSATYDDKAKFEKELATAYVKYAPELQQHIAGSPARWAALRYQWPKMNEQERDDMKTKFKGYLKNMAPNYLAKVEPPQRKQGSGGSYAEQMARLQQQHNNYVFLSNMMTMHHIGMMNSINNIGNSPYYYTYH